MAYIIIEGIDGAGKTTIARALSHELEIPYWDAWAGMKQPTLPGCNDFAEDLAVMDFARQAGISAISDRGIVSAQVYRKFEGRPTLSRADMLALWEYAPECTIYIRIHRPINRCRLARFNLVQLERLGILFDTFGMQIPRRIKQIDYKNTMTVDAAVAELKQEILEAMQ